MTTPSPSNSNEVIDLISESDEYSTDEENILPPKISYGNLNHLYKYLLY